MANASSNLFAIEQPLIDRLAELKAPVPDLRCGAAITLVGTTNVAALLPGVFVRPMGHISAEPAGQMIQERQRWEVIAAVQAIADKQDLKTTYAALGKLAHRLITHIHGWTAPDIGTFEYSGRSDLTEIPGHAELTLTFDATVVIDLQDDTAINDFLRFYPTYELTDSTQATDAEDHINLPGPQGGTP